MLEPRWSRAEARRILARVATKHGLDPDTLTVHMRYRFVVNARWEAWSLLAELGMPYSQIGALTNHDHSSVIYGIKRYRERHCKDALLGVGSPSHPTTGGSYVHLAVDNDQQTEAGKDRTGAGQSGVDLDTSRGGGYTASGQG